MTINYIFCKACQIFIKVFRIVENPVCPMCGETINQRGEENEKSN